MGIGVCLDADVRDLLGGQPRLLPRAQKRQLLGCLLGHGRGPRLEFGIRFCGLCSQNPILRALFVQGVFLGVLVRERGNF